MLQFEGEQASFISLKITPLIDVIPQWDKLLASEIGVGNLSFHLWNMEGPYPAPLVSNNPCSSATQIATMVFTIAVVLAISPVVGSLKKPCDSNPELFF